MTYTTAAIIGVVGAVLLDLIVLRTKLLARKVFWASYVIIVAFQLLVNGILTGKNLVVYAPHDIIGTRIVHAPVEDLMFGFSLVLQTLSWWIWWGRRTSARPPSKATLHG
jgi:lycopene cyclase domain-containing protein